MTPGWKNAAGFFVRANRSGLLFFIVIFYRCLCETVESIARLHVLRLQERG
jgi:hypothetical protein